MRHLTFLALLASSSSLAAAAPPSQCAVPGPAPESSAVPAPAAPALPPAPVTKPTIAAPAEPVALGGPFLQRVQASGATLVDLGVAHGLHRVAARTGEQFMIFSVLPDGSAAVSGPPVELTPEEMSKVAGAGVTELGVSHGFRGYFVRSGMHFQVFYATPDGRGLIPGVLYDEAGKDITRQQVAGIPGAVPTVEVTDGKGAPGVSALPLVRKAAFATIGRASAPLVYMLIDPQCIYSIRAMQMLGHSIDAGKLQVAVVPLSVLDYEDKGASTQAALALLSKPADQLVAAWQARDVNGPSTPEARTKLQLNMEVAQAIGLKGTPTLVWRKSDGGEGRIDGLPTSVPDLLTSVGG